MHDNYARSTFHAIRIVEVSSFLNGSSEFSSIPYDLHSTLFDYVAWHKLLIKGIGKILYICYMVYWLKLGLDSRET